MDVTIISLNVNNSCHDITENSLFGVKVHYDTYQTQRWRSICQFVYQHFLVSFNIFHLKAKMNQTITVTWYLYKMLFSQISYTTNNWLQFFSVFHDATSFVFLINSDILFSVKEKVKINRTTRCLRCMLGTHNIYSAI